MQQVFHAHVVVNRREVDADSISDELVSAQRPPRERIEAGNQRERHDQRSAVPEVDDQPPAADAHRTDTKYDQFRFNRIVDQFG